MVNALVISKDVKFIKTLLDELSENELEIRVSSIATSYTNIVKTIDFSDFKIVFVDDSVPRGRSKNLFRIYKKKIVSLSYKPNTQMLSPNQLIILRRLSSFHDITAIRSFALKELMRIGFKIKYKGTNYLADAIAYVAFSQPNIADNLRNDIYPIIAKKYDKSPNNIKSSMTKATEYMYCECDSKFIQDYFGFCFENKPTVKQVIFTVASKL